MKRFMALLLVVILFSGCSALENAELPPDIAEALDSEDAGLVTEQELQPTPTANPISEKETVAEKPLSQDVLASIDTPAPSESPVPMAIPVVTFESTPAPTPTATPKPTATPMSVKGYIDANSLNLRSSPSRSGDVIKEYKGGQTLEIVGKDGDWYKVAIAGAVGYMLAEYIEAGTPPTRAITQDTDHETMEKTPESEEPKVHEEEKVVEPEEEPVRAASGMVWIPTKGGKKYHSHEDCSNMNGPRQVSVEEAERLGFTACKKCY